jgi:group I intron endonuclease
MVNKICGIYMIKNMFNNKMYIGKSIDITRRWKKHKSDLNNNRHDNKHLQSAWNKYGQSAFKFSIVEECSEDNLNIREIYYIQLYNSCNDLYGYNMTFGGDGCIPTDEVRKKMSDSAKHRPPISEETRKKHSEKMSGEKNYFYNVHLIGEENGFYGDHRFAGKNHPRCRAVYCYELNEYFWGAKEAADKYGMYKADIAKCCKGKLKSAGKHPVTGEKLHWVYADEINNSSAA